MEAQAVACGALVLSALHRESCGGDDAKRRSDCTTGPESANRLHIRFTVSMFLQENDPMRTLTSLKPLTLLASVLFALPALNMLAAELDPAHVPADAQWLIHVDAEALSDAQLAEKIRQKKPEITGAIHQWMEQRYGINPPEDLYSITMFSRDYREHTGTVVIRADYDAAKVEQRLREAKQHQTAQWNDYTLHTIMLSKQKPSDDGPSGDQEMTVVMVDKETLLLASSVDNAKETLKLLAGETKSLKDQDSPLLSDQARTAWMYGAART